MILIAVALGLRLQPDCEIAERHLRGPAIPDTIVESDQRSCARRRSGPARDPFLPWQSANRVRARFGPSVARWIRDLRVEKQAATAEHLRQTCGS